MSIYMEPNEYNSKAECVVSVDDLFILIEGNVVNAWPLKVGVAISTQKIVAMLLKDNLRRLLLTNLNGENLKHKRRKEAYLGVQS